MDSLWFMAKKIAWLCANVLWRLAYPVLLPVILLAVAAFVILKLVWIDDLMIEEIWCYPIKSCAGILFESIHVDARGLDHDREWAIIDSETGKVVTQRQNPKLALIQPKIIGRGMEVMELEYMGDVANSYRNIIRIPMREHVVAEYLLRARKRKKDREEAERKAKEEAEKKAKEEEERLRKAAMAEESDADAEADGFVLPKTPPKSTRKKPPRIFTFGANDEELEKIITPQGSRPTSPTKLEKCQDKESYVKLMKEDMRTVSIWGDDVECLDAGDLAAKWLRYALEDDHEAVAKAMKRPKGGEEESKSAGTKTNPAPYKFEDGPVGKYRLVKMIYYHQRVTSKLEDDEVDYDVNAGAKVKKPYGEVNMSDSRPFLVVTRQSLDALGRKLEERAAKTGPSDVAGNPTAIDTIDLKTRFRPNFVISGGVSWEEDCWRTLEIHGVSTDGVKSYIELWCQPCCRCKMPTNQMLQGEFGTSNEPIATLSEFHKGIDLGMEAAPRKHKEVYFGCYGDHGLQEKMYVHRYSAARVSSVRKKQANILLRRRRESMWLLGGVFSLLYKGMDSLSRRQNIGTRQQPKDEDKTKVE